MAVAKLGQLDVTKCMLQNKEVKKAYLGNLLVCDSIDQINLLLRYTFSRVKTGRKT